MPGPLKNRIVQTNHDELFAELILEATPHLFAGDVRACRTWIAELARRLKVDPSEIKIIGGAAVGFSLNPRKNFGAFSPQSDIDVAIISDHYFSEAWRFLRSLDLTLAQLTNPQRNSIRDHRGRLIYWGTIAADKILPILPFAQPWMAAAAHMSGLPPADQRDINFRIYKDFGALRAYQMQGLASLRTKIIDGEP